MQFLRINMAGGGLMQLVAYGPQDVYLTGNPEVTFFKTMYRRHTNFAVESIEQTFSGTIDFGKRATATVSRNGDLINRTYFQVALPALTGTGTQAWVRNLGNIMIDNIVVNIGGSQIDKHYGIFMHIWQELTLTAEHEDTYNVMIGNTTVLTTEAATIPATTLYIPLQFWFNTNIGLSLPLIALQYHEVQFVFELRPFSSLYVSSSGTVTPASISYASLWIDYVYLDTDERRQFAQIQHEYLIEQLQFTGAESFSQTAVKQRLNFNHPCKELIWVAQLDSNVQSVAAAGGLANRWGDFTDNGVGANPYNGGDLVYDAKLQLNGHDRFNVRLAGYFNLVQPYDHHTRGPATGIYTYSFAEKPEDHQPSGSVNMSRIDNATLVLTMNSSASMQLYTYMKNYNVMRVLSGMAGLAYSN
jgi:hypothetical protein